MGETKVNLAIIDTDLVIRSIKKYPLSSNGRQITVVNGGENHFMPVITNTSYLEFPRTKKYLFFGSRTYQKIYFAMNKAKKCVNFASGDVSLPSPEQLKAAIASTMLSKMGKPETGLIWWHWAVLISSVLSFILLLNMSGVLR